MYPPDQDIIHQRIQTPRHISPTSYQQSIRRLKSCKLIPDNIVELFTTSLPKSTFQKFVQGIGMPNYSYIMLVVLLWKFCQTQESIQKYSYLILMYYFSLRLGAFSPLIFCYLTRFWRGTYPGLVIPFWALLLASRRCIVWLYVTSHFSHWSMGFSPTRGFTVSRFCEFYLLCILSLIWDSHSLIVLTSSILLTIIEVLMRHLLEYLHAQVGVLQYYLFRNVIV